MKISSLLVCLGFFVSCSGAKEEKSDKKVISKTEITKSPEDESILYINKAGYFEETNEFYVSLTFNKPFNDAYFTELTEKTDSLISKEEDEETRNRLPMAIAKESFNLDQLQHLKIYNSNHVFVTNARLVRTEYFEFINGYFIGVYKPEKPIHNTQADFYAMSTANVALKRISEKDIQDSALTARIKRELKIDPEYEYQVDHIIVKPYKSVFSIYAFISKNGETISYLTEFSNDTLQVLYTLKEDYILNYLSPVPVEINHKPVFLIHLSLPDSDAVDEFVLATFNGTDYQLSNDNRIKIR